MITFTVVMNAVAGPDGRFRLMSSRWGIVCTASAAAMVAVGWFLDRVSFPINYQVIFIIMALFGFAGSYISHQIILEPQVIQESEEKGGFKKRFEDFSSQVLKSQPFLSFTTKRFVFALGTMMTYPLFPLYYVRQVHASDLWIGIINTAQMAVIVLGYFFWMRLSKKRKDPYYILLVTAFATALYPAMVALTGRVEIIVIIVGVIAFFQAGADLSFFDEQLRNTPNENPVTFIAVSQSVQYLASMIGPLLGSFLADQWGLSIAMIIGGSMKMVSFVLFLVYKKNRL